MFVRVCTRVEITHAIGVVNKYTCNLPRQQYDVLEVGYQVFEWEFELISLF